MQKNTKDLIKFLLDNELKIPRLFWRDIVWLQEVPKLGIMRNSQLIWTDDFGTHTTNWQNFFRKAKIKINDREISQRLSDYILLLKADQLTAHDVIHCRNAQIRSHLLRSFGQERLIKELGAKILHQDGPSQLLQVNLGKHLEPMLLVKVKDSTTGDFYLLRVPPHMKTCKQAIAWTFGLEEIEYSPVKET